VLGKSWAEELATLAGLKSEVFLRRLVHLLPEVVHRMTSEPALETPFELARPHDG
jgi:uncharacterized protein YidB (DUF937 family)